MATVSETGWPYLQHRGGPKGFVKVLDDRTLGLADYRGNRQYVSLGNLANDDRAALFFMDYPRQARLKLLARVRAVDLANEPKFAAALVDADYKAKVERALLIRVEAFDWNCPQHITPRFNAEEVRPRHHKARGSDRGARSRNTGAKDTRWLIGPFGKMEREGCIKLQVQWQTFCADRSRCPASAAL